LRIVPASVMVETGSFGGVSSLFVRGGQSDYVKVLVDGVPVNQAGGAYDFANLTTDNVDRIEIVRGPASVLYGSDAVTGVVQVFTRTGSGPGRADLVAQGGGYGTRDWQAAVGGGAGMLHYSIAASRFTSDGIYAFNNQYDNTPVSAQLRLTQPGTDATLSLHYDAYTYHFPTDGAGVPVDSAQATNGTGPTWGFELGHRFTPSLETRLVLGVHSLKAGYTDLPDSANFFTRYQSVDEERRVDGDLRTDLRFAQGSTLSLGVALDQEHDQTSNLCQTQSPPGDCSSPATDQRRHNDAVYLQLLRAPDRGAAITAGLRVEDNERFGTYATYRGGVAYPLGRDTRLRLNIGTGFREPSFAENYSTAFSVGNPALRPEHSFSGEVGLEQSVVGGRARLRATGFLQRFRDLIDYDPTVPAGAPNYANIAGASADGVELGGELAPTAGLSFGASYTYLHTEVTSAGFDSTGGATLAPGQPLVRRPGHAGRVDARYSTSRGSAWLAVTYVGARADQDFSTFPATRVTLPAYARVDLALDLTLLRERGAAPGVSATARVENLLDAAYDEVERFPARRRTVFIGAHLRFGY